MQNLIEEPSNQSRGFFIVQTTYKPGSGRVIERYATIEYETIEERWSEIGPVEETEIQNKNFIITKLLCAIKNIYNNITYAKFFTIFLE